METIVLKNGLKLPALGFGTDGILVKNFNLAIDDAVSCGYTLFDTATAYNNHFQLGKVLSAKKNNYIYSTKFNNEDLFKYKNTEKVIENILCELSVQYVDLFLIHNPKVANFKNVFKELIRIKSSGRICSIGVSNFTTSHLKVLEDNIEHVDINQVEFHPLLSQPELKKYCDKHEIKIMAYRPFGGGEKKILNNSLLNKIAVKYKKSTAQIILRWLIQKNCIVIPRSSNSLRIKENFNIFDFQLSDLDIKKIDMLNETFRTCTGAWAEFND